MKPVSCIATRFLAALLMVDGASGDRGQSVQPHVGVELVCEVASAITLLLREKEESAVVLLTSKRSVTVMPVQVCKLAIKTVLSYCHTEVYKESASKE